MADFDKPKISTEEQQATPTVPQSSSEALDQEKQDKHALLAKVDHPELKKLAKGELAELIDLESQKA